MIIIKDGWTYDLIDGVYFFNDEVENSLKCLRVFGFTLNGFEYEVIVKDFFSSLLNDCANDLLNNNVLVWEIISTLNEMFNTSLEIEDIEDLEYKRMEKIKK